MIEDERRHDHGKPARQRGEWELDWKSNVHRDVWLFLITVLVLISIVTAYNQNKQRIADIQASRLEVCERSNARHDQAIKTTMAILARPAAPSQRKLTPAQRAASQRQVIRWVDSLVPKVDCAKILQPPSLPSQHGK
jgi:hypothetical protein